MAGTTTTVEEGYMNGSDELVAIADGAIGHSTTATVTFNSDTKDRAVKPPAKEGMQAGLWKGKGVTGLSISVSAEGLRYYQETENGYEAIAANWGKGKSVGLSVFHRSDSSANGGKPTNPYLKGKFVITSVETTTPAQDDATYTINFENDGEPEIYPGKETASDASAQAAEG